MSTNQKLKEVNSKTEEFAFGKQNYVLMVIGIVVIGIGYMLMSGGGADDPNVFDEQIFNFRRLTLAPVVILLGFIIELFAIMRKTRD